MALGNTRNVLVGIPDSSGGLWVGDLIEDSALLPDATTDLAEAGFIPAGFIGEDGVTEANERDVDKIKAWGGDTVRVIQNDHTITYSFTFLELGNFEVLKLIYGDENVEQSGDQIIVKKNSQVLPHKTWVIEVFDKGADRKIRLVIPDGQITETGDRNFTHSDVVSMEVTIEAFVDKEGNKGYEYQVEAKKATTPPENDTPGGADPVDPEPTPQPDPEPSEEPEPEAPITEPEYPTYPRPVTEPDTPVTEPETDPEEPETDPEPTRPTYPSYPYPGTDTPETEPEAEPEDPTTGTDPNEGRTSPRDPLFGI